MKHLLRLRTAISVAHSQARVALLVERSQRRDFVGHSSSPADGSLSQVNSGGQECPPHALQYRSECSDYVAGFQRGFRPEPALYLVAEILALADHVDGSSGGPADWPDAAFFGVV